MRRQTRKELVLGQLQPQKFNVLLPRFARESFCANSFTGISEGRGRNKGGLIRGRELIWVNPDRGVQTSMQAIVKERYSLSVRAARIDVSMK